MKLDSHHIERLVPWFGYGNFNEAEVVFLEMKKDWAATQLKRF